MRAGECLFLREERSEARVRGVKTELAANVDHSDADLGTLLSVSAA